MSATLGSSGIRRSRISRCPNQESIANQFGGGGGRQFVIKAAVVCEAPRARVRQRKEFVLGW